MSRGGLLMWLLAQIGAGMVVLGFSMSTHPVPPEGTSCVVEQVRWPMPNTNYHPMFLRPKAA